MSFSLEYGKVTQSESSMLVPTLLPKYLHEDCGKRTSKNCSIVDHYIMNSKKGMLTGANIGGPNIKKMHKTKGSRTRIINPNFKNKNVY